MDPGSEALGPFGFPNPGDPEELPGAVLRARGRAWWLSLVSSAILLCKLNTVSAQTSWLALVPQRCSLVSDLGVTVALEPQLFPTWPEGSGNGRGLLAFLSCQIEGCI